jgi:ABC-type polysaccharide/polyol phosphate transport system ATPase subunit
MNSIITSDKKSDLPLVTVEGLHLVLPYRRYGFNSLRDLFTNIARSPLESLLSPKRSIHVLNNINFQIFPGERVAVLGVNGSGKTSLCRCLAGMISPNAGKIQINGDCQAFFDAQAGIIPELTGLENGRLLADFLYPNITKTERQKLVDEATEFSELNEFLQSPWESYSLGMKARLFLSLATALPADLLILDEVYDNTDHFFQKKMTARLLNFIKLSRAVLFVSHSEKLVKEICNRGLVLSDSKIVYDGAIEDAVKAYHFLNETSAYI